MTEVSSKELCKIFDVAMDAHIQDIEDDRAEEPPTTPPGEEAHVPPLAAQQQTPPPEEQLQQGSRWSFRRRLKGKGFYKGMQ
jgi:hypothetical protein